MKNHNRHISLALILVVAIAILIGAIYRLRRHQMQDGGMWLSWSTSAKRAYIDGYLMGYRNGHIDGCIHYAAVEGSKVVIDTTHPQEVPEMKCGELAPKFQRDLDYYAERVTTFYNSYPADRSIDLQMLLSKLSDSENLTVEQIHDWFKVHGHIRDVGKLFDSNSP